MHSMQHDLFNQMIAERFAALAQMPGLPYLEAGADISGFLGGLDAFSLEVAVKQGKFKEGFQTAWELVEKVKRFGFTQTEMERQNKISLVVWKPHSEKKIKRVLKVLLASIKNYF